MTSFSTFAVAFHIGSLTVRWYGIIICCAMLIGMLLAYKETEREHLDPDDLLNLLIMIIPLALIGARAYYVILRWDYYGANPSEIIKLWHGGSAIYGGIILCIIGIAVYCRVKKQSFFRWVDIIVPELALGQCIGRWGNFTNAEAYGPVIEAGSRWSWVPLQVFADGAYHHPIFLYESICDGILFIILLIMIRRKHRCGSIFAGYLIGYGTARFFIEFLRQDQLLIGGIQAAHIISAICVAVGVFILWYFRKQPLIDVAAVTPAKKKTDAKQKKK